VSTISVIIATYGDIEWAHMAESRAYPSLERQDDPDFDFITRHEEHGTRATSLNNAAAETTGEYLLWLDADDEFAPGYVGAMRRALERNTSDGTRVLFTPAVQQIRKGRPGRPFFFPECSFETGNWIVIGTMISRELFMEIGGFHEHPHGLEDWNLWARAVRAGASVVKVKDAVYRAHMNPKSKHHVLSRNRPEYMAAYEVARLDAWG
jgi:GT2 family glycosyltransferase